MPNILYGDEFTGQRIRGLEDKEFNYSYPSGLDLNPKSDTHRKMVTKILRYAQEASGSISTRFDSWNEIDRTLTAFIEVDDKEQEVIYNDPRKPVSIVFPYTYAIMETILAYMVAAFFQQPIFRYEGVSPEDVIGSIMLEKVVDLHCNKTKVMLDLHTMFRDALAYGVGFVAPYWKTEYGMVSKKTMSLFGTPGKETVEELIFEGNAIGNIDPYLALPDPNVPIHKIQDGEFFGWVEKTNYHNMLTREKDGSYFNVKYVDFVQNKRTSIYGEEKSDRKKKAASKRLNRYHTEPSSGGKVRGVNEVTKPVDIVHMFVKLIPKEWELGSGEYPEKWLFSVAADSVIVRAKPLGLNHGKFPVTVAAPDFDGYSSLPMSRLEMLYGLQGVLDWMFNAHVANVRKTINDMLIYDPFLVNSKDINSPEAGKRIRMRRPAWGKGVKDAVMQIPVADVTKQHVQDSSWIVQWMQKIGAADDVAMGSLRQGGPERLTGAEFKGTQMGQLSRLGRIARIIGLQAMQDIGEMFGAHTQQLMTQENYVKVTGDWQQVLLKEYGADKLRQQKGRIKVSPYDLLINYDVMVRDGSIPGANFSEVWVRLFETIAKTPELYQTFDLSRIFMHIARNNGAKNVQEFVRVKVAPDAQVQQMAQQGNVIPFDPSQMGGMNG